jgi:glycerophosphoryl diester phosphodiesterase
MRRLMWTLVSVVGVTACNQSDPAYQWETLDGAPPLVIAHRGASGDRPEHTLEAFRLAIRQGADVIEPDLVMTSDGVLIVRHDRYLSASTNVSDVAEFTDRRRVSGDRDDWWAEDFTLAEIRSLRARQPFAGRSVDFDNEFLVATFEEVLDLAAEYNVRTEPEVKSPGLLTAQGLDPMPELVRILRARNLDTADAPTSIQCFEPDFLARLDAVIDTPLLMLVFSMQELDPSVGALVPTVALADMVDFADGVGPDKALVVDADGHDTGFIAQAHALGLSVHPWTFRDDRPVSDGADIEAELRRMFLLGADGVFADFPATAVRVRSEMSE